MFDRKPNKGEHYLNKKLFEYHIFGLCRRNCCEPIALGEPLLD